MGSVVQVLNQSAARPPAWDPLTLRPRLATGLPLSRKKRRFVVFCAARFRFAILAGIRRTAPLKNLGQVQNPVKCSDRFSVIFREINCNWHAGLKKLAFKVWPKWGDGIP